MNYHTNRREKMNDETQGGLFDPRPEEGRQRKERALDEHEVRKGQAIRWLRGQLAELYQIDRTPVCADDARAIYEGSNFPKEYSANRTFFGSIFRGRDWEVVGRTHSTFPANNDREIKTWRYVGL